MFKTNAAKLRQPPFSGATLRKKVMGLVGITLLSLLAFDAGFYIFLSSRHYDNYEIKQIKRNASRAINAIDQELYHLDIFLSDWSAWDDTYEYIQNHNEEYVKANLLDNTFVTSKLNLMAFLDSTHQIVYVKLYDLENGTVIPISDSLHDSIQSYSKRIRLTDLDASLNGLMEYSDGIMFVAARPIVKTDQTGPVAGTLIIGRIFNQEKLQELSKNLELSIRLVRPSDPNRTSDEIHIIDVLKNSNEPYARFDNPSMSTGFVLIKDIWGEANILLEVLIPRELNTLRADEFVTSVLLLIVIAVMCIVLIGILSRTVFKRVELLSEQVSLIGSSLESKQTTAISGDDELSGLSTEINRMLTRLQVTTESLRESEKRFRDILSNVQLLGFILDAKGHIQYCNRYLLRVTGYEFDEILNRDWFELFPPEEMRKQRRENYLEQIRTERFTTVSIHEIETKNGSRRTIAFHITPLHDNRGNANGIAVIGEDITDRLRVERENNRLATLVESASEAICLFDRENRIIYVNPAFEKLYGYHEDELLFKQIEILSSTKNHPDASSLMMETLNQGQSWRCREVNLRHDQTTIDVEVSFVPVRDLDRNILYFGRFARDITQETELQNQLNRAQRLVAIGELTGGIAHNFNNLLTAIIGNIGLAKAGSDGTAESYLTDAENAS
ncbi:MAG: PAS domain S-box protein, partial [bacterium]|nr:PAS domain S-box protein [bacterium]